VFSREVQERDELRQGLTGFKAQMKRNRIHRVRKASCFYTPNYGSILKSFD
jgi:inorganic pyrophosphatase